MRSDPSAMFEGTDTTALRSWSLNAYISRLGNMSMKEYTSLTSNFASLYIIKSKNVNLSIFANR